MGCAGTRRVSLHDGDARPIAKGRLGKSVEFGHKARVTDNDEGIVVDHTVEVGNPADAPQLAPAVERVTARTGRKPRTVGGLHRGLGRDCLNRVPGGRQYAGACCRRRAPNRWPAAL
jgi:hypothetical protein